ncbi:carbon-nitrogen hydrolase [Crucibulum laeve]|uniref:Carbon-nitrogen hydrolase n=1 Tax=Crucibulum laeve TaxID=68775 RepID=A0A5C3LKH1_9AGAR|nr:carbon-nitrogen hydrolase [Crucibulum laeve]
MPVPKVNLRIAVVQFSPKIGQVQANLLKARDLCRKLQPRSVDLVCFPEMAFTGYVFPNSTSILPHLEKPRTGPTSEFCSELAKKLECYVVAGYPEELTEGEVTYLNSDHEDNHENQPNRQVGANSAVFYGPDGGWVGGYRKTNLFETDMTWAKAGDGFVTFDLPSPLRTLSLGICMDLNPHPPALWTLVEGPYEIADYCICKKTNVLVLLNAWLDSGKETDEEHDWSVLNYWAARLRPLWNSESESDTDSADVENIAEDLAVSHVPGEETIVVICNRTGSENEKTFAGSSAVFSMHKGSGRPKLLDMMSRTEEGIRVWNLLI